MPNQDGTGPLGNGAQTGNRQGNCNSTPRNNNGRRNPGCFKRCKQWIRNKTNNSPEL